MKGLKRENYSCVAIIPAAQADDGVMDRLRLLRISGVKIWVITDDAAFFSTLQSSLGGFHSEIHLAEGIRLSHAMEFDGALSKASHKILRKLDKISAFNYNQFILEHEEISANIMVAAGAGTGKTTSMVSRISYLIFRHNLDGHALPDAIFMLTFSKSAAAHMKTKLAAYFRDYFALTRDEAALALERAVGRMRIDTIHALARRLLNVEVVDTNQIKFDFLGRALEEYGGEQAEGLQEHLFYLLSQMRRKNIDPEDENLDWGKPSDPVFHEMMLAALRRAARDTRRHLAASRKAGLDDLIPLALNSPIAPEENPPQYVFVDEFQDSDNTQIALIQRLRELYGFKLFVVGDIKQCIYRFRGADSTAFETLAGSARGFNLHYLNKNYRSDRRLLDELNGHFSLWGAFGLLEYKRRDRLVGLRDLGETAPVTAIAESAENGLISALAALDSEDIAILVRKNHQVERIKKMLAAKGMAFGDKITIMTIHKAKGLEFDIVILPHLPNIFKQKSRTYETEISMHDKYISYSIEINFELFTNNHHEMFKKIEAKERQAEEARILYVATTRAKRRLIHFGEFPAP
ncbi:MAG: UvrD-helicase domain-containing protein [Clostridiales bacterium]|jgi:superfamily I DNA/RNA helicase|nr:UvrD-helicase domain-containing protein [Clostridiales bacterium]